MRSLFQFVPGCFLLVFAMLAASTRADNGYQCNTLHDKNAKGRVYFISMFQSEMLIITKDFPPLVYEVPANKIRNDSVDMHQVMPESMDTKWPVIFNDPYFHKTAQFIHDDVNDVGASIAIKFDKEFLLLNNAFSWGKEFLVKTFTCTLDPGTLSYVDYVAGDSFDSLQYQPGYISSDEPNVFFNLWTYPRHTSFHLNKYVYRQNAFWAEWSVDICLSIEQGTQTLAFYKRDSNCSKLNWDITNAFTYQEHFYLFDANQVYIFHYQTANIVGTKEIVTTVAFKNYFQCIGPTTVPSLSSTPSMAFPSTTTTNHSNATLTNSTESITEDLLDAIPKPLEIASITMSLILIFVLLSICVWQVLTSEDEDQSVPNLKGLSKSRVYVSNSLDSMFKERRTTHTQ